MQSKILFNSKQDKEYETRLGTSFESGFDIPAVGESKPRKKKREHDCLCKVSLVTFILAAVAVIIAACLFFSRLHDGSPPLLDDAESPASCVDYLRSNLKPDALSAVFTILGLVNLSFPFIVNVKNTRLYNISLSQVMYAEFWWHGIAYGLYSLLVIGGLYFAKMGYLFGAYVCLIGNVFAYISTAALASAFVYRQHKTTRHMIENYLTMPHKENEDSRIEKLLQSGDYVRAFFEATQTVPKRVVKSLLVEFAKEPFDLRLKTGSSTAAFFMYTYSASRNSKKNKAADTVKAVLLARFVWERILNGLDAFAQANLLRQTLYVLAEYLSEEDRCRGKTVPSDTIEFVINVINRSSVMLCGLEAYRETIFSGTQSYYKHRQNWERLFNQILSANVYSVMDKPDKDKDCYFRTVLQCLVLLSGSAALVEALSMSPDSYENSNEFWKNMLRLLEKFEFSMDHLRKFFPFGQVIMLSSGNPDYNPEKGYIRSYCLLQRIFTIRYKKITYRGIR